MEAEIKGLDGDKYLVETKDGRVRNASYLPNLFPIHIYPYIFINIFSSLFV